MEIKKYLSLSTKLFSIHNHKDNYKNGKFPPKVERRKIFKSDRSIHEEIISSFPGPCISCRETEPPTQPRAEMNQAGIEVPLSSILALG